MKSLDVVAKVGTHEATGQGALFSSVDLHTGDLLCDFSAREDSPFARRDTLQIGEHRHVRLEPRDLVFLNHSCDPTVFVDTAALQVLCLRDIAPGDELTFFYPSTEWEMDEGFTCACGSVQCCGHISGARTMPRDVLRQYRLSAHIEALLERSAER